MEERKSKLEQTLPLHIAKSGVDYFFATNSSRHVRFYGPGEPTQEFELLKQITEYAQSKSDCVTVEIQTNGVFGKRVREWMLDNLNIIWVSFDGLPDTQNFNRPTQKGFPSAPILEDNVTWFNNNKGDRNLMVGARVTMTEKNINQQCEMVDYFLDLGIQYVWTNPLFFAVDKIPICEDSAKLNSYSFDMDKYINNYLEAFRYAKTKNVFWGSFLGVNFDGESPYHCRACTPVPHFTPDGYVSACDMVVLGADAYHMDCLIYGKWDEETQNFIFDKRKVEALQQRASTADSFVHCSSCSAKLHCGGYCLGEVVNETGKLNGVPKNCNAVRRLLKELGTCAPYEYLHP
jgi:radical SAM protein with 4Fe4S-binding SPASM domain